MMTAHQEHAVCRRAVRISISLEKILSLTEQEEGRELLRPNLG